MDVSVLILLIADSDIPCREALRRFFVNCGFAVHVAGDAPECVATLQVVEPDILIIHLDLPLGGGDGIVTRIDEGSLGLSKPPTVLVLGGTSADAIAWRAGVPRSRCLTKPIQMLRLIDAACRAIASEESRQATEPHQEYTEEIILTC